QPHSRLPLQDGEKGSSGKHPGPEKTSDDLPGLGLGTRGGAELPLRGSDPRSVIATISARVGDQNAKRAPWTFGIQPVKGARRLIDGEPVRDQIERIHAAFLDQPQ